MAISTIGDLVHWNYSPLLEVRGVLITSTNIYPFSFNIDRILTVVNFKMEKIAQMVKKDHFFELSLVAVVWTKNSNNG